MTPLLDDVEMVLVNEGLAGPSVAGWPIFKGMLPDEPSAVVCLFESPSGLVPGRREEHDNPEVQVRIRGLRDGYAVAMAKLLEIYTFLHGRRMDGASGSYPWAIAQQSPFTIGPDVNGRPQVAVNFMIGREW